MRKAIVPAFLLLLGGAVLGATVLHQPLASAAGNVPSFFIANDASNAVPVQEQNLASAGNLKVHEAGTANVNVTNSTLSVSAANGPIPVSGTVSIGGTTTEIQSPDIHVDGGNTYHYTVDTSRFSEIRVSVTCLDNCPLHGNADAGDASIKFLDEHGNDLYSGHDTTFGSGDPPWNVTLDLPGTTMDVVLKAEESSKAFEVVVWGR